MSSARDYPCLRPYSCIWRPKAISKRGLGSNQGPGLGAIPAALWALMGAVETAVASIIIVLSAIPAICNQRAKEALKFGAEHFANGLCNIISAAFSAIPFLGLLCCVVRGCLEATGSHHKGRCITILSMN